MHGPKRKVSRYVPVPKVSIQHTITPLEACKLIAASEGGYAGLDRRYISKQEMVALARAAVKSTNDGKDYGP